VHQTKSLYLHVILSVFLLLAGSENLSHAQATITSRPRLIIKLRTQLASDVEKSLPMRGMRLAQGQVMGSSVQSFLQRHTAHSLSPVYPNIVRRKKQLGQTDLQIANAISQRYPARARRFRDSFQPPEISRAYILEVDTDSAAGVAKALAELHADPDVEYAEPDHVTHTNMIPNDPYFSSSGTWGQPYDDLWGVKRINAPSAWDTAAGAGFTVAVVDTGIDYNHPDIAANVWTNTKEMAGNGIDDDGNGYVDDVRGWDFIGSTYTNPTQSNNPIDHFGHGTHVAGTIAAVGNNGIGVIGVAWQAQVMAVKGLDDQGYGLDSTLAPAILYAVNNGADVISNSWSGAGTSQTIADAIAYAYSLGAVVVAAAGNNNDDALNYYPGNLPDVITVAASDHNDVIAYFSNWGTKIDVAAPGVDILSLRAAGTSMGTPVDAYYTRADGTSMATPHVSGLAALILSQHPIYINEDVRQALRASATDLGQAGFDPTFGYGRIDAAAALALPDVLQAKIQSPANNTHVKAATAISGLAQGSTFAQYVLDYGTGTSPATWITLQTSSTPVSGGTLGVFDPSTLAEGIYTIRLTAHDQTGRPFVDRITLVVDYVSISVPVPPAVPTTAAEFKPGTLVSIQGTATGAAFQDFRVQWAEGLNPSSAWSTTGLTLAGDGTFPISNGLLATWDTSSITTAGYYTVQLLVDNSGSTSQASTLVYLEPDLFTVNWPQWLNQAPETMYSGLVPEIDSAGNVHLTAISPAYSTSTIPSQFWSFSPDGSSVSAQPLFYGSYFQPAAAEIDGIAGDEAAVPEAQSLRLFRNDGTSYSLATGAVSPVYYNFQFAQTVLEDLNGDSELETIAMGNYWTNNLAYVFAWRRDGQQLNANFPIAIADQNISLRNAQGPRVLVGDIHGDGAREIVVQEGTTTSTSKLRLFGGDGTPLVWSAPVFTGHPGEMILADLDHNGKLETVVTVDTGSQRVLHVLQPDGTERPGWPFVLALDGISYLAAGDLLRSGQDEIVVSNYNYLYVLTASGTPLSGAWPRVEGSMNPFGPVVLADIDGDGRPEIITTREQLFTSPNPLLTSASAASQGTPVLSAPNTTINKTMGLDGSLVVNAQVSSASQGTSNYYVAPQILALHGDNTIIRSWNLMGANGNQPDYFNMLTVGDFNHDGITDIAAIYWTISGGGVNGALQEGVATVLTTGAPFNPSVNDWPMIYQNARNTAVLIHDHTPPSVTISAPAAGSTVAGVVNIVASASDNVGVTAVQFQLDGANIGPQVVTAPFNLSWDFTAVVSGAHTLSAVAWDAAGNSAVSASVSVNVVPPITVSLSPAALSFGGQLLLSSSAPQAVTVTNTGSGVAAISAVQTTGDFSQSNNCSSLPVGASCTISVTFTPTIRGAESGTLSVAGNFTAAAPTIALTGTGQGLLGTLSPSSLNFGGQPIGYISSPQILTYTNVGDLPLTISGISASGDFAQTNNCPASLTVNSSCSISVTFKPTVRGPESGQLSVTGSTAASAQLSGSALALLASVSPNSLNFGNQLPNTTSSPLTVTISNVGDYPFYINSWGIGGSFAQTNNCPFTLAVGNNCTVNLTFTPGSIGTFSGYLSIGGNFSGSTITVTLSGTGINPASLAPASLSFGNQLVNTSSPSQSLTLSNAGTTAVSIFQIQAKFSNGAGATMFPQTNNCGSSLAAGASCSIAVQFQPSALGDVSASLYVITNTGPLATTLTGTGIGPMASFSPVSLTFAPQRVNTSSSAQNVSLSNSGTAPLTITNIATTGEFSQSNNCGSAVAVGASCTIAVTFNPLVRGSLTGTVYMTSNTVGTSPSTNMTGTGIAPVAATAPASLTFAAQNVASTSSPQAVTLTNSGDATLNISGIAATGDFAQTNNCGATLGAGANCTIHLTFTPTATGTRNGSLSISDDSNGGSPQTVALSGTGIAPAAALSPASLTFASQRVNRSSATQSVSLSNPGTATLSITSFAITGDFSQTNNCAATLAPGGACTLTITFTPTARGSRTGTLTVNSNAPGAAPVTTLSGTGVASIAAASPASLSFSGTVLGITSTAQAVTVTNSGDASLTLNNITVTGDFAQSNNCGASVVPGANCTISVTFAPAAAGNRSGSLTVSDDSLSGSLQSVSLAGVGLDYSVSASPSSVTVSAGSSARYTATVSALGGTFPSSVALSCSGLPAAASCTFSPASVTPGSGTANSTMTVTTTRRKGSNGTPAGTYSLTINAVSGARQHSTTVTMVVN
jgi:subtilisin family serine protease